MACPPRDAFQIGWICALPIEAAAAKEMLDENFGILDAQDPADTNAYTLGRIGKHYVVIACLPGGQYGTTSATTVANHMVRTFSKSLRIGLMVGVGGAIPSVTRDIRLGDIVIGCPEGTSGGVLQYDMGKIGASGEFYHTGSLNSPPRPLLTALNLMRAAELTDDPLYPGYILQSTDRNTRTRITFMHPGAQQDRLFKPEYDHPENADQCNTCLTEWEELRGGRGSVSPQPHYGIIASGNSVIKDARTRDQLGLKTGALCCEMEAAGLMMDFPCIVIRGICDYADTHKNKQWQGYAALAAASYAKELLGYVSTGYIVQEQLVVNFYDEIKEEVGGINQRLDEARNQREKHHDERKTRTLTRQQQKCHQVFKIGNYTEQKDINPPPAEGTCKWALESSEYRNWLNSDFNQLLWVSADPGCGKSVLARSIIDGQMHHSRSAATVCYFFFKENDEQNNLAAALCSILHQFFSQRPDLLHHAIPAWEQNGQKLREETDELWRIFKLAISSSTSPKIILIFDALDECREVDQNRLIQNLHSFCHMAYEATEGSQQPQEAQLRILVTSRPYNHIQNCFRSIADPDFPYLHLRGEDENDMISKEIDVFVMMRVKELALTASLPLHIQQHLEQQILRMGHRTYLWIHLAFDDIQSTFEHSLRPHRESIEMLIPPSVEKAYEKILRRIPSEQMNTARKIFQIIIGARRPLTIRELGMALGISLQPKSRTPEEAGIDLTHLEKKLRSICGLFVFVKNSHVHLFHQTAREYLEKEASVNQSLSVYQCTYENTEDQMAQICLKYLSMEGLDNNLADESSKSADLLEYSATYWADHVRAMTLEGELEPELIDRLNFVYDTATQQFSIWFPMFWKRRGLNTEFPDLTAIHLAALNGHQSVVRRLLSESRITPNLPDTTGSYPLTYASLGGYHYIVLMIIEHGGDVNARGGPLGSALRAACIIGHEKVLQTLLRCGADANTESTIGNILCTASYRGQNRIVQMLLDHGADINYQPEHNMDALNYAILGKNDETVRILLENGADANYQFARPRNALVAAIEAGVYGFLPKMLNFSADVEPLGGLRSTALEAACHLGNDRVVQLLLNFQNCVEKRAPRRALKIACMEGFDKIVDVLLSHEFDFNIEDLRFALDVACSKGHHKILPLLFAHGVDLNAQLGFIGIFALSRARRGGHEKVVQILSEHGAGSGYLRDIVGGRLPVFALSCYYCALALAVAYYYFFVHQ